MANVNFLQLHLKKKTSRYKLIGLAIIFIIDVDGQLRSSLALFNILKELECLYCDGIKREPFCPEKNNGQQKL